MISPQGRDFTEAEHRAIMGDKWTDDRIAAKRLALEKTCGQPAPKAKSTAPLRFAVASVALLLVGAWRIIVPSDGLTADLSWIFGVTVGALSQWIWR